MVIDLLQHSDHKAYTLVIVIHNCTMTEIQDNSTNIFLDCTDQGVSVVLLWEETGIWSTRKINHLSNLITTYQLMCWQWHSNIHVGFRIHIRAQPGRNLKVSIFLLLTEHWLTHVTILAVVCISPSCILLILPLLLHNRKKKAFSLHLIKTCSITLCLNITFSMHLAKNVKWVGQPQRRSDSNGIKSNIS